MDYDFALDCSLLYTNFNCACECVWIIVVSEFYFVFIFWAQNVGSIFIVV